MTGASLARTIVRFEPWLLLPAGLPLVFRERFPLWLQVAALLWIGMLWLARRYATGRWTVRTVLDVPAALLLLTIPGAIMAVDHTWADTPVAISRAESLVFAVAFCYAIVNAVSSPRRLWSTVTWLLIAGLGLAAVGVVSVDWIGKYPPLNPVIERLPRIITNVPHASLEAVGVHPNTLASLLVLLIPLSLAVLVWPRGDGEVLTDVRAPRWVRPVALTAFVVLMPVLLLTQSRGAWLALVVAVCGMAALRSRAVAGLLGGAALVLVLGVLLLGPAKIAGQAGAPTEDPGSLNVAGRLDLWRRSAELLSEHPAAGIGLNTYPLVFGQDERHPDWYVYQGYAHAHNTLLQTALDYGVPGFVAMVGLYVALAWAVWRIRRRTIGTPLDAVAVGLAAGLAAHALHGFFDALAIGGKPGFVPWAMAGALAGMRYYVRDWVPRGESSSNRDRRSKAS